MDHNRALAASGAHFAALVAHPQTAARWTEASALAGLSVGGVAAHAVQGVVWLDRLLDVAAPEDAPAVGIGEYLAGFTIADAAELDGDRARSIRDAAERGAKRTPEETAGRLREVLARLRTRLAAEPGDRLLDMRPSLPWAMRLDDRVRLTIVELVIHGDDLAVSAGLDGAPDPPPEAVTIAIDALVAAPRFRHGDRAVLRALARRERSRPDVFPVL